ncbi:MAG: DUF2207 domain-containing protein [Acidimicrobiia bacterium]|nr:DUF2207 domain-containing protein [Acidimicrobiia bacterium]
MSPDPLPEARRAGRAGPFAGLALVLAVLLAPLVAPGTAGAQGSDERILAYDVDLRLDDQGTMAITEVIDYRFPAGEQRQGIFRYIPIRVRYDDRYDRAYDPQDFAVRAEPVEGRGDAGRAAAFTVTDDDNGNRQLRIGTAGNFISGTWRYTISYAVPRTVEAIEQPDAHYQEMAWNAVGTGWPVPIEGVDVAFSGPGPVIDSTCFTGVAGSTDACASTTVDGSGFTAEVDGLPPHEGVTIGIALPPGTVANATPSLVERWSFARAFEATPLKLGLAGGLAALAAGGLATMLSRQARDRRLVMDAYLPADASPDTAGLVGFFDKADGPVRFRPPEGATPGLVGVIVDESADALDVTATLVDLAVRGYLRIEETGDGDYRFVRLRDADAELLPYEADLLRRLWVYGPHGSVELGALQRKFSGDLGAVREGLYQEVQRRHWFVRRPDRARAFWVAVGIGALLLGAVVLVALAALTTWGLVGLAALVPGIVVLAAAKFMPARTSTGRRVLEEAIGFERFLDVADADQLRFQETQHQFVAGLPYAMVFGLTGKWAQTLAVLQEQGYDLAPSWYVPYGVGAPFHFAYFGMAMSNLTHATTSTFSTPPASTSGGGFGGSMGGFSGGGGGGGGGGSW